ncbi:MAG TPA: Mrp/NBP35 family ATP-binding protein [Symbiobacteriaceae bacterium]
MTLCERPVPCELCPEAETCRLDQERHAIWLVDKRLSAISRRILVMSNKGGVGKSTVTANLAVSLAQQGLRTGLLDADLSGPSQPALFGMADVRVQAGTDGLIPVEPMPGLKLISSGLLLASPDDAIMWRDSYKFDFLMHLIGGVAWGPLDCLLIDMPPGTGGELIGIVDLLGRVDGAVIVTTPQQVAVLDARKAIAACRDSGVPVLGVVENMSGMACPHCGGQVHPFRSGGGEVAARSLDVPFLGRIPLDGRVMELSDEGRPPMLAEPDSPGARAVSAVAERLVAGWSSHVVQ